MTITVEKQVTVNLIECAECGTFIALAGRAERDLRDNGRTFYCYQGHRNHWSKTALDRMQEQLDAANARAARLAEESAAAQKKLTAAKRESTRLAKRAAAGVCPCCNRTFQQLARHMKSKHPEATK